MATGKPPSAKSKAAAIVSKPDKPELDRIVPELVKWLREHGFQLVVDRETAPYAEGVEVLEREQIGLRALKFMIVLGGDGTFLSAARSAAKAGTPILGVNLGSLGFLTEVPLEELHATLAGIESGKFDLDVRAMVHCEVIRKGERVGGYDAVNDIVVGKGTISRLNHCDVYVDGVFVSAYKADSLIVSTPTGSTAYSLAAGGPILMPTVSALVVTPVSAHTLTLRPLVVPDTSEIELVVNTGADEAYLSVDGQVGMPMYDGDRVRCGKSELQVKLLRVKATFFDVLRAKLKWGQR
jgi:NAD+ kinase